MALEMGAEYPIVLPPRCPEGEDPEVQGFLRLALAVSGAKWAELDLEPNGPAPSRLYRLGAGKKGAMTLTLEVGADFEATLRLGVTDLPSTDLVAVITEALTRILRYREMLIQTTLLDRALGTTSSSILLFGDDGEILYANPSADTLLSRQTEDDLLVSCQGQPRQPLFTLLSSMVETVASNDHASPGWAGAIEFDEGRVMSCEVTRLPESETGAPGAVLVHLHSLETEGHARLQAFSSSHGLSPREQEVLELLGRGLTTGAMAESLGISPHTVRDHLKHLYSKTGTKGRNELLRLISRTS
jgi:DNA-binding CsgD family transcriptional regulator